MAKPKRMTRPFGSSLWIIPLDHPFGSSMIDRITPTKRPLGKNCGTQTWQALFFGHWEVPLAWLRPRVPAELEIDLYQGRAFIGLVPFQMKNIRPSWLPRWMAQNFLESNLRTYVLCEGRPGVYFFSLDANSRLAVWFARNGWSLPYYYAQMASRQTERHYSYVSKRLNSSQNHFSSQDSMPSKNPGHDIEFRIGEDLGVSEVGTLEHFLFERYLLFVARKGIIYSGQVYHTPYPVNLAEVEKCEQRLTDAAGLGPLTRLPDLAHYSPGVEVEVFAVEPTKVKASSF